MKNWTVERVKAELPDVPVRANVHRWDVTMGRLSGRQNAYATVSWPTDRGTIFSMEVAWGTVAAVLNDQGRTVLA